MGNTSHCILHTVDCTLYTAHYILSAVNCQLQSSNWKIQLNTAHVTLHCKLNTSYCHRRPCLNELQKEYCMKTKLDWTETEWPWWSTVMKNGLILTFFCEVFSDYLCSHLYFSSSNDNTAIYHTCLTLCWPYLHFTAGH